MASMSLDPSSALAEKYKGNRQILEQAVLGRSAEPIDPYSALRALQKLNVADRYEMMQKAMQGQPNPPSIAEQTVAQAAQAQAPQGGGLAAMPVPEDSFNMAGGGLVAFADGAEVPEPTDELANTQLTPEGLQRLTEAQKRLELVEQTIRSSGMSPEEQQAAIDSRVSSLKNLLGGKNYYSDINKKLEGMEQARVAGLERAKGLGALQAAAAMAQGSDFTRGLGGAFGAFGKTYGEAYGASEKEKRELLNAQIGLSDAQRKENLALYNAAVSGLSSADKSAMERYKAAIEGVKADAALARAGRAPTTPSRKVDAEIFDAYVASFKSRGYNETDARRMAAETYQQYKQAIPTAGSTAIDAAEMVNKEWLRLRTPERNAILAKEGEAAWKRNRQKELMGSIDPRVVSPRISPDDVEEGGIDPIPSGTVPNPGVR